MEEILIENLERELRVAEKKARENFESRVDAGFIGLISDKIELANNIIESYKEVFLRKDEDFIQEYLLGKEFNIFNKKYMAARQALAEIC